MKKYFAKSITLAALIGCGSVMFSSCEDTLDADKYFDDRMTFESVFTDINQTNNWLSQAFSYLSDHLADVSTKEQNGRCFHVFADDIFYGDRDSALGAGFGSSDSYASFKQGDYNENYGADFWINAYRGIYQASVFMQYIHLQDKISEEQKTDMKGQARFVRAYYYWLLLRKFGPVPILPDEGADYTLNYEDLSYPRASYEEVAEFISDEMIQACKELSNWSRTQGGGDTDPENIVRPTRGAALATRALALLYAASPLANGQLTNGVHPSLVTDGFVKQLVNKDGKQLLSTTYDERKWARAAAACRDVMECPAGYELYARPKMDTNSPKTGYPKTLDPFQDGDFSEKDWPEGYRDIDPYLSYRDFFNGKVALDNTEIIFSRGYNTSSGDYRHGSVDGLVTHALPSSHFGWNSHGMTQKMVDAYYMNDGSDVPGRNSEWSQYYEDPDDYNTLPRTTGWTARRPKTSDEVNCKDYPELGENADGVSLQYARREPRFYASVSYSGSFWWSQNSDLSDSDKYKQIYYYRGNYNGVNNGVSNTSTYWQRSGIGLKKYVNPEDWRKEKAAWDYDHIVRKWEPAIRYADILLMYAEAINELSSSYTIPSWDGSQQYTVSRDVNEMKRGIRPVRCRAGVPDFEPSVYADQAKFRKKLKRERMIELMGEGKRYYDLRRWMDAPLEESIPVYGCNVYMPGTNRDDFMKVVPVYSLPTVFNEKMYFWPISTSELKRNKNLVQNPGWKYYD